MAREILGYTPTEEREYVPKAFDNRLDPNPIKVWIRTPALKDKRLIEGDESAIRFSVDGDCNPLRDKNGNLVMQIDKEEITRRHHKAIERLVVRVENYTGPGKKPIINGVDLAAHGETEIITEVFQEIMSEVSLSVEESKK